ncbi:hypothetical protein, partial [Pseudomonas putida]|uniref:hypothetical protein n=1 Tax=Pseudomonas putida TaxID=303 RepID=UPI001CF6F8EB
SATFAVTPVQKHSISLCHKRKCVLKLQLYDSPPLKHPYGVPSWRLAGSNVKSSGSLVAQRPITIGRAPRAGIDAF